VGTAAPLDSLCYGCKLIVAESIRRGRDLATQCRTIPVRDANGDQLTVYELLIYSFFGFVAERRWELCSGEAVEPFRDNIFMTAKGEELRTCDPSWVAPYAVAAE
jgi:hypothetical protein